MHLLEERYLDKRSKYFTKKIIGEFETKEGAYKKAREMKYKIPGAVSCFNITGMNEEGYVCSYQSFIQNIKNDSWRIDYYIISQ